MNIKSFYSYVRKLYCDDLHNWHPVYGVEGKPLVMNGKDFHDRMYTESLHWWMWEEFNEYANYLPDMIEECEYAFGRFYIKNDNDFIPLKPPKAIRLSRPITRVSKWNLKSSNQGKIVEQWHIPPGKFIDSIDIKQKAEMAYEWIKNGMTIEEARKKVGLNYRNLVKYTDFKPSKTEDTRKKVEKVKKLILSGMSQAEALRQVNLPKFTFWRLAGTKNQILSEKENNGTES